MVQDCQTWNFLALETNHPEDSSISKLLSCMKLGWKSRGLDFHVCSDFPHLPPIQKYFEKRGLWLVKIQDSVSCAWCAPYYPPVCGRWVDLLCLGLSTNFIVKNVPLWCEGWQEQQNWTVSCILKRSQNTDLQLSPVTILRWGRRTASLGTGWEPGSPLLWAQRPSAS